MKQNLWAVFTLVLINWTYRIYAVRNVALNGKTSQSSDYGLMFGSDKAVDGNRDDDAEKGSCTHTRFGDENPTFQVEFPQSSITNITIYNRGDCCLSRLSYYNLQLFNNNVQVYNYSGPDMQGRENDTIYLTTYVVATKAVISTTYFSGKHTDPILTLCEVEIYGDCPDSFYGDDCIKECSNHCADVCNKDNGYCTCKPGYTGLTCHGETPSKNKQMSSSQMSSLSYIGIGIGISLGVIILIA